MEIARLYLRGVAQCEIAAQINAQRDYELSQQMVSYDLKAVQALWKASSVRDFGDRKAEELAKIDKLEQTYWEAWERSLDESRRQTQLAKADSAGQPIPVSATVVTEDRLGDPRYLAGVMQCIEGRCKLLGLNAPEKHDDVDGEIARLLALLVNAGQIAAGGALASGSAAAGTAQ